MGTSSSYTAPTSGNWPKAKGAVTRFSQQGGTGGGPTTPAQVVAAYVAAHGGAANASTSAIAGRTAAQRLGSFFGAAATDLRSALEKAGLTDLVGRDAAEVLAALVDQLASANSTLDESASHAAMAAVLDEQFAAADTFADLEALCSERLDMPGVLSLLEQFLVEYVYWRMAAEIGERIQKGAVTIADACKVERDLRAFIAEEVKFELALTDQATVDLNGPAGEALVARLFSEAYGQLEGENA